MPNPTGSLIGPYSVVAPLGAGGMGEVFRARDARLGRDVAIKALPEAFARDPERLARFEREARLLASLSHPNIAGIHGVEESGGQRYLILEFVEGVTLQKRLERGPLQVDEALDVCRQIAAGIETAHESGVVHRDLKPGNVMLTPSGDVKVLDFGLAKGGSGTGSPSDPGLSASPTMTYAATSAGVILGTAAYMSPEQARGRVVDRRTDIWSFGCVLYECLTGRKCFDGETLSDTIALILQRDVDWTALPAGTPARVRQLLARCLERDARKRLRDAGEARIALEEALGAGPQPEGAPGATSRPDVRGRWLAGVLGAVVGVALAAVAWRALPGTGTAPARVVRHAIDVPEGRAIEGEEFLGAMQWDVSPDGERVAARLRQPPGATGPRLFTRRLDATEWTPVPGSERAVGFPILHRDHRTLHFVSEISAESPELRMLRVDVEDGSAPVTVCEVPDESFDSVPIDGDRVFMTHSDGRRMAVVSRGAAGPPDWQPIERGTFEGQVDLTYAAPAPALGRDRIFVGTTLYRSDGWHRGTAVLDLRTRRLTPVLLDGQWPALHPSGVLLFSRGATVFATRFDARTARARGEAVPVASGLRTRGEWMPGRFRLTERGDLLYSAGGAVGELRSLVWIDLAGNPTPFSPVLRGYSTTPALTPDGRRVAASATNARGFDEIWTFQDDDRAGQRTIRADAADVSRPVLTRDGARVAYSQQGIDGKRALLVSPFAGGGAPRLLVSSTTPDTAYHALDWFPDGRHLLARAGSSPLNGRLLVLDADPSAQGTAPARFVLAGFNVFGARLAPDGRRLAFESNRSGRSQVFACTIAPDGTASDPVLIAAAGFDPVWSSDGRRVLVADSLLTRAVEVGEGIRPLASRVLGTVGAHADRVRGATPLPDGRLLCILEAPEGREVRRIERVQDWWSSVKRKMPR